MCKRKISDSKVVINCRLVNVRDKSIDTDLSILNERRRERMVRKTHYNTLAPASTKLERVGRRKLSKRPKNKLKASLLN